MPVECRTRFGDFAQLQSEGGPGSSIGIRSSRTIARIRPLRSTTGARGKDSTAPFRSVYSMGAVRHRFGRRSRKVKSIESDTAAGIFMRRVSQMQPGDFPDAPRLERFRDYLRLLTRVQLGTAWDGRIDPSDLVQQTLLEAYQKRDQFRGTERCRARGVASHHPGPQSGGCYPRAGRQKRDVTRERSLEADLETSSACLGAWLAAEQSTPSEQAVRHEQAVLLANALARLPGSQREALVLHYWQGFSLAEIATRLERTPAAAAGLLKRGLKNLRALLDSSSR